ncbi:MAG: MOSC domain-containing protein [Kofleriaceae bacterium]|nr:MOSC domain-containing protein [Kofleriaceae bacterium]
MQVGRLAEIWRYPVKSMAGEALAVAELGTAGVVGDRAFAIVDVETGTVASAKHPRKWSQLLSCRASLQAPERMTIVLPDGTELDSARPDLDARLSLAFGRAVRLSSAPPAAPTYEEFNASTGAATIEPLAVGEGGGTFFDLAPIHFVTTSTLARMHELVPGANIDRARFRPNFVIDTGADVGFVENVWNEQVLSVGDEAQLRVVFTCPRCVMTTLAQGALPAEPAILRAAAEHNKQPCSRFGGRRFATVGMYASVVRRGTVRPGDAIRVG